MNYENIFTCSILCLSLASCSGQKESVSRIPFVITPEHTQKLSEGDYHWVDSSLQTDACAFLGSKRLNEEPPTSNEPGASSTTAPSSTFSRFQLYQSIFVEKGKIVGSHAVSKLPQILFTLSGEAAESGGTMYKSYDPVSFYRLAKKEFCPKIPIYCEKLIKHDEKNEALDENKRLLAETSKKIAELEKAFNDAVNVDDLDSIKEISPQLTQQRVFRDHLKIKIDVQEAEVSTLDAQVQNAEKEQRLNSNDDQIKALNSIEDLIYAINHWQPDWTSYVYSIQKAYTEGRNAKIEEIINRRAPGALDGKHGDLSKSDLFIMYLRYLKVALPSENDASLVAKLIPEIDSLRPILTSELSLFSDSDPNLRSWVNFERDAANSIALLSTEPSSVEDATCKFVLSQRLIAQILTIKGIRQAPALTKEGFLEKLQKDPSHEVSHVDINGVFKTVVDEAWLQKALNSPGQESPLPYGTIVERGAERELYPVEYFSWIRGLAHVVASANAPFWVRVKSAPTSQELIPGDLLKLSFGMMAVGLQAMQTHFLRIERPDVSIIPADSAEAYATLVQATIESLRAFDAQYKMHQEIPDLAFLNEEQLKSIKPNGDKKVLLSSLLYAANKGAMRFYNMPETSRPLKTDLKSAINRSGVYLRNQFLYEFGFEGPRN